MNVYKNILYYKPDKSISLDINLGENSALSKFNLALPSIVTDFFETKILYLSLYAGNIGRVIDFYSINNEHQLCFRGENILI